MLLHSRTDVENFRHVNSITHEGKVLLVATDSDGVLWYSVKQDGFEDSYLRAEPAHRTGWETWKRLPLPGRRKNERGEWQDEENPDDPSVIEQENKELTVTREGDTKGRLIMRSRYNTYGQSAVAPVQLVSGLGHLYVFRQSKTGTLLADRFVLDGMTNQLVRKLEVRFKRSGQRYQPLQATQHGKPGQLASVDSLDFRDANSRAFYEPTTELGWINKLHQGWFAVVLVPTTDHDVNRWHVFAYNSETEKVEIISIRASEQGLFDVKDHFVSHPQPTQISGIIRRSLNLTNSDDRPLKVVNGIAATKYDIQTERQTKDGPQLLRESTRIMLAIPTDDGNTATLSFAVASDGTLSRISEKPEGTDKPLRVTEREIMLPLNTLDEIKAIGDSTPPLHGQITALKRSDDDRVVVTTDPTSLGQLGQGDFVTIEGTASFDGHYEHAKVPDQEKHKFSVGLKTPGSIGAWSKLEKEKTGLIFDGIITGLERNGDSIEVTSPGHGLHHDAAVQIDATHDCNGVYQVAAIDGSEFTLERKWQPGQAINLKREADKRRGIQFDEARAYIETPVLELDDPASEKPCGSTYSAWIYIPRERGAHDRLLLAQKDESVRLMLSSGHVVLEVSGFEPLEDPEPIPGGEWVHYAAVVPSTQSRLNSADAVTLSLCRNGLKVTSPDLGAGSLKVVEKTQKRPQEETLKKLQLNDKGRKNTIGADVSISGDSAIVAATTLPGSQYTFVLGAAYIFTRSGKAWNQAQKLQADGRESAGYGFGLRVGISGHTAIVADPVLGAAYLFGRQDGKWNQLEKLQSSAGSSDTAFAQSVAISGNTVLVGANTLDIWNAGSIHFFTCMESGGCDDGQRLQASDKMKNQYFGHCVAIDGDLAIVGTDGTTGQPGAAYVFMRQNGTWVETKKLQAEVKLKDNGFGRSVAISGDKVVVGAPRAAHGEGAAYVFTRQNNDWMQAQTLQAEDKHVGGNFGQSVAIDGGTVIVGTGGKISRPGSGSAYVFKRQNGEWTQTDKLHQEARSGFGISVAICGTTAFIGAHGNPVGDVFHWAFQRPPGSKSQRRTAFWIGGNSAADADGAVKLAEVQIWNRARSPQEIKDSMFLTLSGQETDLAGYWRLGGIVPGDPRTVVDFSVHGRDATVIGDVFVADRSLDRHLNATDDGGKAIAATAFVNEDLFAVSQRAKYVESFEFRVDGGVNPADHLFSFSYWGKKSRGSDGRIPEKPEQADKLFAVNASSFKPVTDVVAASQGWYIASCSFIVPDGVTLVRSFGIAKVTGGWNLLHFRKHRVTCVSDRITEERLTDGVKFMPVKQAGAKDARAALNADWEEAAPLY